MFFILNLLKNALKLLLVAFVAILLLMAGYLALLAISRNSPLALPAPTGSSAVGRVELDWTDPNRIDPLAGQANLKRELAIWIWYPARMVSSQKPAPYLPPAWQRARDQDQGIGVLIEHDFSKIQTYSYANAPISSEQGTYPVLIMQPGMGPSVPDYTVLAENLASHGYIVVGINPTYTSNWVGFPDGRVITRSTAGAIPDSATSAQVDQMGNAIIAVWAQDVVFVLDQLPDLNALTGSPFHQRLDLAHTGVFGHSFGGATAIAVCQQDSRCKAAANLDGIPFSAELKAALPVPLLLMGEDDSSGCDQSCTVFRQFAAVAPSGAVYDLSVKGAGHFNFSDLPLRQVPAVRPLFTAAHYSGAIDPARGEQIANAYLLAFFDRYLKNSASRLLDGPSPIYPEVQFH